MWYQNLCWRFLELLGAHPVVSLPTDLFIERFCMTGGNSPIGYLKAYHTNLYLSSDAEKVSGAIEEGESGVWPGSSGGSEPVVSVGRWGLPFPHQDGTSFVPQRASSFHGNKPFHELRSSSKAKALFSPSISCMQSEVCYLRTCYGCKMSWGQAAGSVGVCVSLLFARIFFRSLGNCHPSPRALCPQGSPQPPSSAPAETWRCQRSSCVWRSMAMLCSSRMSRSRL